MSEEKKNFNTKFQKPRSNSESCLNIKLYKKENVSNKNKINSNDINTNRNYKMESNKSTKSTKLEIYYDKILGSGSFAKVYVAKYKGKLVAVKIINIKNAKDKLVKQFKRELDIIRILRDNPHNNIPEYYKIIEDKAKYRIIIVMEWCRGGELTNIIKSCLDIVQIKYYFSQIVSGYLHLLNLNIIHRDVKSQNIMLSHNLNTVKIIDFGLSKIINTDMTRTVVGSPAYMAPERLGSQNYNSTSDIWSLGIVLYEMLYQSNPFKECKNKDMLIKSANVPIIFPKTRQFSEINICKDDITKDNENKQLNKIITKKTETIPEYILEFMKGILNIKPVDRYDWEDIDDSKFLFMDIFESEKLEGLLESYREIRKNTVNRTKEIDNKTDNNNIDNNNIDNNKTDKFNVINRILNKNSNSGSNTYSDILSDTDDDSEFKNKNTIDRTRSEAIPILSNINRNRNRNRNNISSPMLMAESVGNVGGASVTDRQLECLEEYFILNDPGIFSLYESKNNELPTRRIKARDSGFVDISFLDDTPFLQKSYDKNSNKTYEMIKSGSSQIGSVIYSSSAPVVSSFSKMAKKTVNVFGRIIAPPQI
jgi:serine/threonine protein kinase